MYKLDLNKPVIGEASITIAKPVEYVFDYVANHFFAHYPLWALEVIDFKPINNNPMQIGALARQTRLDQGQRVETTFEVLALQPPELLVLSGLSAPFTNTYHFQAIHDHSSTRLSFSFEITHLEVFMRPFSKLIRAAIEEGAHNSVNNIKQLLET